MTTLARRNLKLFFRDRTAVFFSLLAVLVLVGLYVFFLSDVMLADLASVEGVKAVLASWLMAGILAVTAVTTPLGALGAMVEDEAWHITRDFKASPVRRRDLAGGYILSAMLVGAILCLVVLAVAGIYLPLAGGGLLTPATLLRMVGLILAAVLCGSSIMFLLTSFFRSTKGYSAASTVVGTLIGFVTGIYIPIGTLPGAVQWVVRCFPMTHAAALLRQTLMQAPLEQMARALPPETVRALRLELGVDLSFGGCVLPAWASVAILAGTTLVCYGLGVAVLSRKRQ